MAPFQNLPVPLINLTTTIPGGGKEELIFDDFNRKRNLSSETNDDSYGDIFIELLRVTLLLTSNTLSLVKKAQPR